ncbi:MAG: D-lyxose/D-mannose family sugar isomerase [Vallitaleaceae bacterium]|nr:D-lyxose/D-mannose family sugar isomerase [Vallitaleaceae bacterium]
MNNNRYYEVVGRFPVIEEDEKPLYPLCNEFPKAKE